jgi:hypothetical protein
VEREKSTDREMGKREKGNRENKRYFFWETGKSLSAFSLHIFYELLTLSLFNPGSK